ncbi:hypothetical protein L6J37_19855 [Photobacterium sp. WH77]|uniref:Cellulose biosynthesis protein BcsF n=1 Tax=Photobacterium arenosum TaxID=2774143 RepID=A0ABR9BQZ6_9GAMM|nr:MULTISPECIES: hypothetical protein [Photobacterium]MBD8514639.1 hypothetical protein [Photobacterium arenosum]MBV7262623.1 hypothetical protein [Photobacterium sp. WH24]MCG2839092.1 hypothetical protein [Photobacterium sp. WH77]MCG2846709.1 hypothetical protein [Photobacterium sp. WH80]MDO6581597.1 hypothetical protein [Photobacterium sp. 2_MG-2023]
MNIDDFLLTAGLSLLTGMVLGYYLRHLITLGKRFHRKYFGRSRYFEQD